MTVFGDKVTESSIDTGGQVKKAWERPVIETFDVADVTMGNGSLNGEGLANRS